MVTIHSLESHSSMQLIEFNRENHLALTQGKHITLFKGLDSHWNARETYQLWKMMPTK